LPAAKVVDFYFLEHRAKLIDLAAFLDRVDRSAAPKDAAADFRLESLRRAITLLLDGRPQRARRVLTLLSDPTAEPIPTAGTKGASGAYPGPARRTKRHTSSRPRKRGTTRR
jgi:UDP-N-acetylmuramoylalanine-D-glutamate ligase